MKLWRFPNIKGSILKYRVPPLWPRYIGEVRTNFAKAYGIKVRCYWELFGKHVKNLGTLCFDPTPREKKKLAWKVHCLLSKWKVNNGPSTLHTKTQFEKEKPCSSHPQEKKCFFCFVFFNFSGFKTLTTFSFFEVSFSNLQKRREYPIFSQNICSHAAKIHPNK